MLEIHLSVHIFAVTILIILAACFLYRYVHRLLADRTSAEENLSAFSRQKGRARVFFDSPSDDIFVTVIHHASPKLDVAREQLRFLVEYLSTNLAGREFEILCFAPRQSLHSGLRRQFPQVRLNVSAFDPSSIQNFTCAALSARGAFIIDGAHIETELPKLPAEPDAGYVSLIDPIPECPYVTGADALVLVAAAKQAAITLLRNVHVTEFGLAEEMRIVAKEKGIALRIEQRKGAEGDRAATYWIVNKVAATFVAAMYKRNIWRIR
jgi:hypothetical protein